VPHPLAVRQAGWEGQGGEAGSVRMVKAQEEVSK